MNTEIGETGHMDEEYNNLKVTSEVMVYDLEISSNKEILKIDQEGEIVFFNKEAAQEYLDSNDGYKDPTTLFMCKLMLKYYDKIVKEGE